MTADVLVFVLLSIGLIGSADFFGGIASKRSNPFSVAAWSQWAGFPVIAVVAVVVGSDVIAKDVLLGVAAGVGSGVGVLALYRGFSVGAIGVVAPIAATFAAMLPIVVGLVAGERPSGIVSVGLVLGLVSVVLVGYVPRTAHLSMESLVHGLVSGAGLAAMVIAYSSTSDESGLTSAVAGRLTAATIATLAAIAIRAPLKVSRDAVASTVLAGVLAGVGMGFFVTASQQGDLILVGVAIALFPAVTVVLAALFLHERLARTQWFGIVLAFFAVAAISIG
ncbi:MAG: EamA family transporter [Actinomycetota bacterium]|nr:EamA family transporter [Actinomycetota bacterium]